LSVHFHISVILCHAFARYMLYLCFYNLLYNLQEMFVIEDNYQCFQGLLFQA